jgi:hypothetical protein
MTMAMATPKGQQQRLAELSNGDSLFHFIRGQYVSQKSYAALQLRPVYVGGLIERWFASEWFSCNLLHFGYPILDNQGRR